MAEPTGVLGDVNLTCAGLPMWMAIRNHWVSMLFLALKSSPQESNIIAQGTSIHFRIIARIEASLVQRSKHQRTADYVSNKAVMIGVTHTPCKASMPSWSWHGYSSSRSSHLELPSSQPEACPMVLVPACTSLSIVYESLHIAVAMRQSWSQSCVAA